MAAASLDIAWDADPAIPAFQRTMEGMLDDAAERLVHIGLIGGGPEAILQEGRGVADLMRRLALSRFCGTVALAPGSSRYRAAWQVWLGRRSWGCGSAASGPPVVRLAAPPPQRAPGGT